MKQYEAVIETLKKLGGVATLGQLNQEVLKINDCSWRTKTPFASIRRIVQERPEIYKIKPGLWALESHRHQLESNGIIVETSQNSDSEMLREFSHTYYQGLLVLLGNMEKYRTYIPPQDKNKQFLKSTLSDLDTLHSRMPEFSYPDIVHRASTVDVIWFSSHGLHDDCLMPSALYEVEHSTDIQNSLLKFNDLQSFNTRMVIVADKNRLMEFKRKLSYSAFSELNANNRVTFLDYEKLVKMYEHKAELYSLDESR